MKKTLLFASVFALSVASSAQCDPAAYDWGTLTYGVSPNPVLGETFETAYLNTPYNEVIYVKAPSSAADIDETLPAAPIDSLVLDSITVFNGIADISISSLGLTVTCNNNGVSPDPCTFLGGGNYCGDISGTPNAAGSFPAKIYVRIFATLFNNTVAFPYQFENFTLQVLDPNTVTETAAAVQLSLSQNYPNPADEYTHIDFAMPSNGDAQLVVFNLVGERKIEKTIKAKRGSNSYKLLTAELQSGIYLYTLQYQNEKLTRRLIVQH
jgi:hypothetical protein